jgi:hypothetical protein
MLIRSALALVFVLNVAAACDSRPGFPLEDDNDAAARAEAGPDSSNVDAGPGPAND